MDPRWWYRGGLVVVLVAFFLLIARAATMAFAPQGKQMDRVEKALFAKPAPPVPPPGAP